MLKKVIATKNNLQLAPKTVRYRSTIREKKDLFWNYKRFYSPRYKLINFFSDLFFIIGLCLWGIGIAISTYYGYHSKWHYSNFFTNISNVILIGNVMSFGGAVLFCIGGCWQNFSQQSKSLKVSACWNKILIVVLLSMTTLFLGIGISSYNNNGTCWELNLGFSFLWFAVIIFLINIHWFFRQQTKSRTINQGITRKKINGNLNNGKHFNIIRQPKSSNLNIGLKNKYK